MRRSNAQSTLEYLLVLTVIILTLLFASRGGGGQPNGPLRQGLENYFNQTQAAFTNAANITSF